MNYNYPLFLILLLTLSSCGVIRKSAKTDFKEGFYYQKKDNKKQAVYVEIEGESLNIHQTKNKDHKRIIDTTASVQIYHTEMKDGFKEVVVLKKPSFDIDFLTIPLKYRPAQKGVPPQLNTNLNGAVYVGYRTDKYYISYMPNPLQKWDRAINHYGFSFGLIAGLGNTAMTPTTTNNYLATEYDGVIWTKGIAAIIAVNNFTIGLSLGMDNVLDKNNHYWVYENKPWFGLAFGLNLN